jgi:hypothetical protein
MTEEQLKTLSNQSRKEIDRWGRTRSIATQWVNNCHPPWLYKLACEVGEVDSLRNDEVFPALFGKEGARLIEASVKSEFYFWKIVNMLSIEDKINDISTVEKVISDIRNDNTRFHVDRRSIIKDRMTHKDVCKFTALGVILWCHQEDTWVLNPLWFTESELKQAKENRENFG